MHGRVVGRACPRNLAGASERGKCRSRARDVLRSRISLCDRRFTIACEMRGSYIRASCSLFAHELDRDARGAGRDRQGATRVLRGFSPQRVADAIDHRVRTVHRGLLQPRCCRHCDGMFASRQRLGARTLQHPRHLHHARSARRNRVTARDREASCPRPARRHAVDVRADFVGRCRPRGKEFADRRLGRLTAELSRGETLFTSAAQASPCRDAMTSPTRHEKVARWERRSGVQPLARANHRGFDRAFHSFTGDYHGCKKKGREEVGP